MNLLLSPLWLIILPLATAPAIFVIRRRGRLAGLLAALSTLITVRLCLSMPFDWSIDVLGRDISLQPPGRVFLACIFLLATIYLIYASFLSQGRAFCYLILVIMALLAAVTMLQSSVVAVLLLEITVIFMVLIVQSDSQRSVRGTLYYLIAMGMAGPLLLVMVHLTQMRALNPVDNVLPQTAAFLLVLGGAALLGAVPFHAWLYNVGIEGSPLVVGFITSIAHGVIFFKLLGLLREFPWLIRDGNVLLLMLIVGLASVIMGGLLSFFQKELSGVFAWLVLFDTGCLLIGLSATSVEGLAVVAFLWANRAISVTLIGMGMGMLRKERELHSFRDLNGIIWQKPFSVLAIAIGGLSLTGFPLTAGFTARWLVVQSLPAGSQRWAVILIIAGATASIGRLRWLAATAGRSSERTSEGEPWIFRILVILLLAANILSALYPQVVLQPLTQIMGAWVVAP